MLRGLRIFVVEDESLVAMLIEDMLAAFGCQVVDTASRLDEALLKAESLSFDAAIVDVNLNGQESYPFAQRMMERGIPFLFATGYGAGVLPAAFRSVPTLRKPFRESDLRAMLTSVLDRPRR